MTTPPPDDLDAVRQISAALEPFDSADRDRILRWVREKLGMVVNPVRNEAPPSQPTDNPPDAAAQADATTDIKTFLGSKRPSSAIHVAAVVAYYHRFLAPTDKRKEAIGKDELLEACRQAQLKRPKAPQQVLVNALAAGFLDRADRGLYRINAVGENLVAMVLPESPNNTNARAVARRPKAPKAKGGKQKAKRRAS